MIKKYKNRTFITSNINFYLFRMQPFFHQKIIYIFIIAAKAFYLISQYELLNCKN